MTKPRRYTVENGRRYKAGYAPSELMHPIEATCGACGGPAVLLPGGLSCPACSGPEVERILRRDLDRRRVRIGAMPESELLRHSDPLRSMALMPGERCPAPCPACDAEAER